MMMFVVLMQLHSTQKADMIGKWQGVTQASNYGTSITEKEYFYLNADGTFSLTIFVNLKKGDAFVRDLRIEGFGIWRVKNDTLVLVINRVEVPFAKEIYLVTQESLRNLADNFKNKFENEPIRFSTIKHVDSRNLVLINEASKETQYVRE
jgi:hypothetical protein